MSNFMRDPTGDLPWEEDVTGADVVHLTDITVSRHLKLVEDSTGGTHYCHY